MNHTPFSRWAWSVAQKLGFTGIEKTGSGHYKFLHPSVRFVYVPATPHNEWRERKNVQAELEKTSGRKIPRPNSGRVKGQRRKKSFRDLPPSRMSARTARMTDLTDDLEHVDDQIRSLISGGGELVGGENTAC